METLASHVDRLDYVHVLHLYSIFGDLGVSCLMGCFWGTGTVFFLMLFLCDQITTWVLLHQCVMIILNISSNCKIVFDQQRFHTFIQRRLILFTKIRFR